MTETTERPTDTTEGADQNGNGAPALPSDQLKQAAQKLLGALSDKAVTAAVDQVEGLAGRLTGVAESAASGSPARSAAGRRCSRAARATATTRTGAAVAASPVRSSPASRASRTR